MTRREAKLLASLEDEIDDNPHAFYQGVFAGGQPLDDEMDNRPRRQPHAFKPHDPHAPAPELAPEDGGAALALGSEDWENEPPGPPSGRADLFTNAGGTQMYGRTSDGRVYQLTPAPTDLIATPDAPHVKVLSHEDDGVRAWTTIEIPRTYYAIMRVRVIAVPNVGLVLKPLWFNVDDNDGSNHVVHTSGPGFTEYTVPICRLDATTLEGAVAEFVDELPWFEPMLGGTLNKLLEDEDGDYAPTKADELQIAERKAQWWNDRMVELQDVAHRKETIKPTPPYEPRGMALTTERRMGSRVTASEVQQAGEIVMNEWVSTDQPRMREVLSIIFANAMAWALKVRGVDFPCEQCSNSVGSSRDDRGFYRCKHCGYPGQ